MLAVFDTFNTVYRRKIQRYVRLATGGTGHLGLGELPADLQVILAEEASQLASQFLSICIRAIDYCPPVDLEFGEFLRAVITADRELVPDDPWGYREAWIDAFRERGILPSDVNALDEGALAWQPPKEKLRPLTRLSFAQLRFRGDPGHSAGASELGRQAAALGAGISDPKYAGEFGLQTPDGGLDRQTVYRVDQVGAADRPRRADSVRHRRRDIAAPDCQRRPRNRPLIAVLRRQHCHPRAGGRGQVCYPEARGIDPSVPTSSANSCESPRGQQYWALKEDVLAPEPNVLKMLHDQVGREQ